MNEDDVEKLPITIYKLRLFTIFNDAALKGEFSGFIKEAFKYQTDDEEHNEFEEQIEFFRKQGRLN